MSIDAYKPIYLSSHEGSLNDSSMYSLSTGKYALEVMVHRNIQKESQLLYGRPGVKPEMGLSENKGYLILGSL